MTTALIIRTRYFDRLRRGVQTGAEGGVDCECLQWPLWWQVVHNMPSTPVVSSLFGVTKYHETIQVLYRWRCDMVIERDISVVASPARPLVVFGVVMLCLRRDDTRKNCILYGETLWERNESIKND